MRIEKLTIKNYRNYASADVKLGRGVNLFVGNNAQGKTNLLESVYLASVGKSARTPRWQELIKWGENFATVKVNLRKEIGTDEVEIRLDKDKHVLINGLPITKIGELMGVLKTVLFSPDELKIVKDGPSERRRFMDIAICQLSKAYFYTLTRYNKILSQRNKLLKNHPSEDSLIVWDMQLAREGARVIKTRRGFVERLAPIAQTVHLDVTGKEKLSLAYEGIAGENVEEIEQNFLDTLIKNRERDLNFALTHAGPQRDDLALCADGIDLRSFGSQGQQRSTALSLKLAEMELLKAESGEYPVLLLDDVLSELDSYRQSKLLSHIKAYQTIITCTSLPPEVREKLGELTEFRVENGNAHRI